MNTKTLIKITILSYYIVLLSCDSNRTSTNPIQSNNQEIPKALQNEGSYENDILGSFSRKRKYNIVEKLYAEALEKDEKLKHLDDRINHIFNHQDDSLKNYENYLQLNQEYWNSASSLITRIRDSTIAKEMTDVFDLLKSGHKQRSKKHDQKHDSITLKAIELGDRMVALKLITTLSMMKTYQENEVPPIDQLDNLNKDFDKLIKESKAFIKTRK